MKLKKKDKIGQYIKSIKLRHSDMHIEYCDKDSINIEQNFSKDDNMKSFPPNGILNVSDLDYFYYIMHNNLFVGFYRITDLFFKGAIELHGSFNKHNTFLIKSYFELTNCFVNEIMERFPSKRILATAHSKNQGVIRFLHYLNFLKVGQENGKMDFFVYEKIANMNVKIIKAKTLTEKKDFNKYIYLEEGESKFDYDDKFFCENKSFSYNRRIIKITNYFELNGKIKKKSIYRKAVNGNRNKSLGTTKKYEIGLLRRDTKLLNLSQTNKTNIKLSNNTIVFLVFYLFNPNYAVRISLISLLLGVLSIFLAIMSFF